MQIRYGKDITSPWCLTSLGFCPRFYIVVLEMTFLSGHIFHTLFGLLLSFCFPFLFGLYSHSFFFPSSFVQLLLNFRYFLQYRRQWTWIHRLIKQPGSPCYVSISTILQEYWTTCSQYLPMSAIIVAVVPINSAPPLPLPHNQPYPSLQPSEVG